MFRKKIYNDMITRKESLKVKKKALVPYLEQFFYYTVIFIVFFN